MPPPISRLPARRALALAALLLAAGAGPAVAVEGPSGLVVTAGIGGGAELGLTDGKAAVAEAEVVAGWEHESTGVRPEVGLGVGFAPDGHLTVRPGLRWVLPEQPVQLRIAADWSTARDEKQWRWILIGGAFELRWTSTFSLFAGLDIGFPLGAGSGLPLMIRGGAAFRP